MSKRDQGTSKLRYLVLAIMLVAFSAVAVTKTKASPETAAQLLHY